MARLRYYGQKFVPTKGAFGNKSKYQKSLERQANLKKQIEDLENAKSDALKTEVVNDEKPTETEVVEAEVVETQPKKTKSKKVNKKEAENAEVTTE